MSLRELQANLYITSCDNYACYEFLVMLNSYRAQVSGSSQDERTRRLRTLVTHEEGRLQNRSMDGKSSYSLELGSTRGAGEERKSCHCWEDVRKKQLSECQVLYAKLCLGTRYGSW